MSSVIEFIYNKKEWIIGLFLILFIKYLITFYRKVYEHPKGPFPIPIFGNSLVMGVSMFIKKINQMETIINLHEEYGPVFTFWFGNKPFIFVNDLQLIKNAFNSKNHEFMGRAKLIINDMFTQGMGINVVFSDYGPEYLTLKSVAHSAVSKFSLNDKHAHLVSNCVDDTINMIIKNEGFNNAFIPTNYLFHTIFNIMSFTSFGKKYSIDDRDYLYLKQWFMTFNDELQIVDAVSQIPIIDKLFHYRIQKLFKHTKGFRQFLHGEYSHHLSDFKDGVIRDFVDGLISGKRNAINEKNKPEHYLTDSNLTLILVELFSAGIDTTQNTLQWVILLMSNYPEMQKRMRNEIANIIGDRIASYNDKSLCHYVNAFVSECLRFRPPFSFGIPHKALCDGNIDKYYIPKDSNIVSFLYGIHYDPKHWKSPKTFDPNHFLDDSGKYITKKPGFVPFGIGRRTCLGENLALFNLFAITVRILQLTSGFMFVLPDGPESAYLGSHSYFSLQFAPKPFKIILKS